MDDHICPVLTRTPAIVRALFEGAPAEALDFHEMAGAWSPKQVLSHLAEAEITDWMPRVDIILGSDEDRRFRPFDREAGWFGLRDGMRHDCSTSSSGYVTKMSQGCSDWP
jgi:DinB superfamily